MRHITCGQVSFRHNRPPESPQTRLLHSTESSTSGLCWSPTVEASHDHYMRGAIYRLKTSFQGGGGRFPAVAGCEPELDIDLNAMKVSTMVSSMKSAVAKGVNNLRSQW